MQLLMIDREKGRFLEINDQEFELLSKYKGEESAAVL